MSSLEELTLYLRIEDRPTLVDGGHLQNEILAHMPRLHTFTFYIGFESEENVPTLRLSNDDLQRTFTNVGIPHVACVADYWRSGAFQYHAFSLPFKFHRLEHVTNNFLNIVFNYVTYLGLSDGNAFKHEFFIRVTQCFPSLRYLSVINLKPPFWKFSVVPPPVHDKWCSIIEYPHLISLDISCVNIHYVEYFLNDTKTHLPRLTELIVKYKQLKTVTKNFKRNVTRSACAKVKRLILEGSTVGLSDIHHYFPSLSMESCSNAI